VLAARVQEATRRAGIPQLEPVLENPAAAAHGATQAQRSREQDRRALKL
jgi:hypothetical protein